MSAPTTKESTTYSLDFRFSRSKKHSWHIYHIYIYQDYAHVSDQPVRMCMLARAGCCWCDGTRAAHPPARARIPPCAMHVCAVRPLNDSQPCHNGHNKNSFMHSPRSQPMATGRRTKKRWNEKYTTLAAAVDVVKLLLYICVVYGFRVSTHLMPLMLISCECREFYFVIHRNTHTHTHKLCLWFCSVKRQHTILCSWPFTARMLWPTQIGRGERRCTLTHTTHT